MPAPFNPLSILIALLWISIFSCLRFCCSRCIFVLDILLPEERRKNKNLSESSSQPFTVGKYLFEIWRVLVPAAVNDNSIHSTLIESTIFPLPTFTGISLPDGFSFRFDTPKGEMTARHFVLFLRPSFYSGGCGSPLLTLIGGGCLALHSTLFRFRSNDK